MSLNPLEIQKSLYYGYLELLAGLADIAGYPLDLYALPTALEAGVPAQGSYALQIDAQDQLFGLTLTYENNPFEFIVAQNAATGIAVVGILAAIAIPAYQDYTIRSQVAEGLNLASGVRASVSEFHAERGRLPGDLQALGLDEDATAGRYTARIEVANGAVLILYGNEAHQALQGGVLTLVPWLSADGALLWICGRAAAPPGAQALTEAAMDTDLPHKYLPASCRGGSE